MPARQRVTANADRELERSYWSCRQHEGRVVDSSRAEAWVVQMGKNRS